MFDWDTLLSYIHQGNSGNNRFISQVETEENLSPIIAALANTSGGRIIIGMDIKNLHLIGTTVTEPWVKSIVKKMCTPYIHLDIENFVKNNKHIVCITVAEGQRKPYYYKKDCYITDNGPSIRLANDVEINDMKRETAALQQFLEAENEERQDQDVEAISLTPPGFNNSFLTLTNVQEIETQDIPKVSEARSSSNEDFDSIFEDLIDIQENDIDINVSTETAEQIHPQESNFSTPAPKQKEADQKPQPDKELFPLNTRQLKAVRFLKIGNPNVNRIQNKKYRNLYSVSHKTAHIELVDLVSRGILEQEGSGRSTCYRLSEAVLVNSNTAR